MFIILIPPQNGNNCSNNNTKLLASVSDLNVFISLYIHVYYYYYYDVSMHTIHETLLKSKKGQHTITSGYQWKFDLFDWIMLINMNNSSRHETTDSYDESERRKLHTHTKDSDCGNWYCSLAMNFIIIMN